MSQNKVKVTIKSDHIKKVWIGDPCYVISDTLWDSVCEQTFTGDEETAFVITFTRDQVEDAEILLPPEDAPLQFLQCGTMYGDGEYQSETAYEYGVDSGTLGVVPDYLIPMECHEDAERLGKYFDVDGEITLETDGEGTFTFSHNGLVIETIWTGDEDEDDEVLCDDCGYPSEHCVCTEENDEEEDDE
ncbi:MAG: hypothetical protein FWH12_02260 [Treponema sp.]|nr:hypothetical protein [Treponema sp.]